MSADSTRQTERLDHPRLRDHGWLFAVATLLPVLGVFVDQVAEASSTAPLAPSLTALAPLGVLHDLRWLFAYHPNWWAFALEAVAVVVWRGGLIALLVRTGWPRELDPPSWPRAFRSGAIFTIGTAVLMAPFVGLLFGAAAIPLAWLWLPGVGSALIITLLVHRGAIAGNWWRLPTWRTAFWTLLSIAVLTLAGAAIALSPWWLAWLAASAAGTFNAWAWMNVIRDSVRSHGTRPVPPLAPVAAILAIGLMVWTASAFLGRQPQSADGPPGARAQLEAGDQPVLVVRGYGSSWHGGPVDLLPPPFAERIYSYRGLGPDGDPLPYTADDTDDSLFALAELMDRQVRELHARTGEPVRVVADSEGTLVTKLYLAAADDPPVGPVVLTSPLLHPSRVFYPERGENGWGVAASWPLRGDMTLVTALSGRNIDIDSPLARSLVGNAPLMRPLLTCPVRHVDAAILAPLTAAAVTSVDLDSHVPIRWVPATHAKILSSATTNDRLIQALNGRTPPTAVWDSVALVARSMAAPWRVPTLPLRLPPAWWHGQPPAGDPPVDCDTVRRLAEDAVSLEGNGVAGSG